MIMDASTAKTMLSGGLKSILEKEGCPEAFGWIESVLESKSVPLVSERERKRGLGRAGRFVTIGAEPALAELQLIDEAAMKGVCSLACPCFHSIWICAFLR
jgi:hypothetical protein